MSNNSELQKRSGSTMRERNIETTAKWIREGVPKQEIDKRLSLCFCPDTVSDYLRVARLFNESLSNNEIQEKPEITKEEIKDFLKKVDEIGETKKVTGKCKKCNKPVFNNDIFCSDECLKAFYP